MKNTQKAWFKQFWPWFLILLPMAAVIAGISTVIIATSNKPDMVVDDYYTKGKAINRDLTLLENAQQRNITAVVTQTKQRFTVHLTGVKDNSAIRFSLSHATLANRDISLLLSADGKGDFHFDAHSNLTGKWQLRIEPFNTSWRLQKTVILPTRSIHL